MTNLRFSGPALLLRLRGGCLRRGRQAPLQGGRRHRHPLRGAARRARDARDAVDDGGALRPGRRRQGGADDRWPLLGRDARLLHRPCRAGGGGRRPDRPAPRRRHDHDRRAVAGTHRRRVERCRTGRAPPAPGRRAATATSPAACGAMRRPSATPKRVPSPTPAPAPKPTSTPIFSRTLVAAVGSISGVCAGLTALTLSCAPALFFFPEETGSSPIVMVPCSRSLTRPCPPEQPAALS